jgi:hypothetical protein
MIHTSKKKPSAVQSATEHLSTPKIDGFLFEPLKRLTIASTRKTSRFILYFAN